MLGSRIRVVRPGSNDLVAQWDEAIATLRYFSLSPGEAVLVAPGQSATIYSYYPLKNAQDGSGPPVDTPIIIPPTLADTGYLALSIFRQFQETREDVPWFFLPAGQQAVGGVYTGVFQVDPRFTRNTIGPYWGKQNESNNIAYNLSQPNPFVQGYNLFSSSEDHSMPFWFQITPNVQLHNDAITIMFYEKPSNTARFGFAQSTGDATVSNMYFATIPMFNGPGPYQLGVQAQIYAPRWQPAAGNRVVCWYGQMAAGAQLCYNANNAVGMCPLMSTATGEKAIAMVLAQRSRISGA